MNDHLRNPDAVSWEDLKAELGFTPAALREIDAGARRLIAEARGRRLAEIRKRQRITQTQMGVAPLQGPSDLGNQRFDGGRVPMLHWAWRMRSAWLPARRSAATAPL